MSDSKSKIHTFCADKGYTKKVECMEGNTGYTIMGLEQYLNSRTSNGQHQIITINEHKYLVLYRVDYQTWFGVNMFDILPGYTKRLDDYKNERQYKLGEISVPAMGWTIKPEDVKLSVDASGIIPKWGQEPSIGVNCATLELANAYKDIKIDAKNVDKIISIQKIYIPIKDDIRVCVINEDCQWIHISCDEYANTNYHLVGHIDSENPELNILDKGREVVVKYESLLLTSDSSNTYLNKIKNFYIGKVLDEEDKQLFISKDEYDIKSNTRKLDEEFNKISEETTKLEEQLENEQNKENKDKLQEQIDANEEKIKELVITIFNAKKYIKEHIIYKNIISRLPESGLTGGNLYYKKYLKYKNKYLNLKLKK